MVEAWVAGVLALLGVAVGSGGNIVGDLAENLAENTNRSTPRAVSIDYRGGNR